MNASQYIREQELRPFIVEALKLVGFAWVTTVVTVAKSYQIIAFPVVFLVFALARFWEHAIGHKPDDWERENL